VAEVKVSLSLKHAVLAHLEFSSRLIRAAIFVPLVSGWFTGTTEASESRHPNPTSAEFVYQSASPSVFIVEVYGPAGKMIATGSAIAIDTSEVVTNGHVIEDAVRIVVRHGSSSWPAHLIHLDSDHDLAGLLIDGESVKAPKVRLVSSLQIGERVFAIGAPEGLELSLSEGIVSSLRETPGGTLIQTSAPISHGSSGGGLFDEGARLVGVTTFSVKDGQNLNFAIPADWLAQLASHPSTSVPRSETESPVLDALEWFELGKLEEDKGDYVAAATSYRKCVDAKPGFMPAWNNLANACIESGDFGKAVAAAQEATRLEPNDGRVWVTLSRSQHLAGSNDLAVISGQRGIRLDPDMWQAWIAVGAAYVAMKKCDDGLKADSEAARLNSEAHVLEDFAYDEAQCGKHKEAAETLSLAVGKDPSSARYWNLLAGELMEVGNLTEARAAALQAVRLDSKSNGWVSLIIIAHRQRAWDEMIRACNEAIRLEPRRVSLWTELGIAWAYKKDRHMVVQVYEKLKELDDSAAAKFFAGVVVSVPE
jgi:tetratricopeptide (TPR) repeat protein